MSFLPNVQLRLIGRRPSQRLLVSCPHETLRRCVAAKEN